MKNFGIVLQDYVKKTRILPVYKELILSQSWNDEKIENYKLNKLKLLTNHAYHNVPYYQQLFDDHGLTPDDIRCIDDIKKIPVLTRKLASENQKLLIAKNRSFKNIRKGKTGGTTGVPLVFYKDTMDRSFTWASYFRWLDWLGINKEDSTLILWGASTTKKTTGLRKTKEFIVDFLQNNRTINSYNFTDEQFSEVYKFMIRYDPVFLKGYVSTILRLAQYMQMHNLPANKSLKAISTTAETLLPNYRAYIEAIFMISVFDQYGCGEVSGIAYECQRHNGLHVNEEHVIFECLDKDNMAVYEETGRFILTSLDNYIMPFIRYENGDSGILSRNRCDCGVNSQMIKLVEGRTSDLILLRDGRKVRGGFFTSILFDNGITTDIISKFQIIQYENEDIDFLLESSRPIDEKIIFNLKKILEENLNGVNIKQIEHIPFEPNGKFRYIKSGISKSLI